MNLKALTLDGNPMRGIRRDIIARGTQAILEYLRSRMPVPEKENAQPSANAAPSVNVTDNAKQESQPETIRASVADGESKVRSTKNCLLYTSPSPRDRG